MKTMEEPMGNYLQMGSQQHIRALLEIGWSHRRIAEETGVHRETVARYARELPSKPANPIAGSLGQNRPNPIPGPASSAEPYDIQAGVNRGLTAQRIWQARVLRTIRDLARSNQRISVGVIDPINPRVETPEEVRDRVLEPAEYISPSRLGTTDDCGFAPFGDDTSTARQTAFEKIRARVAGTELAARTLGAAAIKV
jgi:hypothetical protein